MQLVCGPCSAKRVAESTFRPRDGGAEAVRVCDQCFAYLAMLPKPADAEAR